MKRSHFERVTLLEADFNAIESAVAQLTPS
jgi:hypothetical protein